MTSFPVRENVKTIESYDVLNLEVASFSSFRDNKKNHFVTVAVADIDHCIKFNWTQ